MVPKKWLAAPALAIIAGFFFLAPVVPYSAAISIPQNYAPDASQICALQVTGQNLTGIRFNSTAQFDEYTACLNQHLLPPTEVTGSSTLAYRLLGVGTPPFPSQVYVTQGDESALVLFQGSRAVTAYEVFVTNATYNPKDTIEVLNSTVQYTGYGDLVFTAAVKNVSPYNMTNVGVGVIGLPASSFLVFPVSGAPATGPRWYQNYLGSECSPILLPGGMCKTGILLGTGNLTGMLDYLALVTGKAGGTSFVYGKSVSQAAPQPGVNQAWVAMLMGKVSQARNGSAFTENSTLDRFAATRFSTASSMPGISDYGFASDAAAYFGEGAGSVTDLLLFPGSASPYQYAGELQANAPHHWALLMDPGYTQYGYFVGTAPYYSVSADCPVTEVPSGGVNITQYFQSYGCTVTALPSATWLVIVLGP
ncbi:MAG: hypothetical protein KGI26_06950 [Thaumarchaeota archaeon]|nr:hypothetical protein [Nitrososphaerota archaeon]